VHRIERQEVGCRLETTGDLVDLDELEMRTSPPRRHGEPPHAAEAVDSDSRRHDPPAVYSGLRMTVAVDGHAEVNSIEVWTVAGTSVGAIGWNPNFGKYRSAVVVRR
jgi:hypothetical protein